MMINYCMIGKNCLFFEILLYSLRFLQLLLFFFPFLMFRSLLFLGPSYHFNLFSFYNINDWSCLSLHSDDFSH
jgi:hypothetical protein